MSNPTSVQTALASPVDNSDQRMMSDDASSSRPLYLRSAGNQIFAIYHQGRREASTAVLICAPWGWEETASYRPRRKLAQRLAAAGFPVLRFDLPTVGDSSGLPGDPHLVESWTAAVGDAAAWLREESGAGTLAALGLGLGGTMAMAAGDAGAPIDELILWASPEQGRHFVRESRAFGQLRAGEGPKSEAVMPPGWMEAGGFTLSPGTVAELKTLKPLQYPPPLLRRVLFLDRDGIETATNLRKRLDGVLPVSTGTGTGWESMVSDSEFSVLPEAPVEAVIAWLGEGDDKRAAPGGPTPATVPASEDFVAEVAGQLIRETPLAVGRPTGSSFLVVSEPAAADRLTSDLCILYLNAGGIRHIGPNRNWVESARKWAARGVRSIRIDLDGIGEADGERPLQKGDAKFYLDVYEQALEAVMQLAEEKGLGRRFICVGLCSGAYWALQLLDRDPRVRSGVLLNARAIVWNPGLSAQHQLRSFFWQSMSRSTSWRKLFRFEVDLLLKTRIVRRAVVWRLRRAIARLRARFAGRTAEGGRKHEVEALFDRVGENEKRVAMAFCSNEPVLADLREDRIVERLSSRWPAIVLGDLPGDSHALSTIPGQVAGSALIDAEIELALES